MSGPSPDNRHLVKAARQAQAAIQWQTAYDRWCEAERGGELGGIELEDMAVVCLMLARTDESIERLQRAYQVHCDRGDHLAAAAAAFWVGFHLYGVGEMAQASGWLGRAQRLVEREGQECAMAGWLLVPRAAQQLSGGDFQQAAKLSEQAAEVGERHGDVDLVAFSRQLHGRALVRAGQLASGLALLDEVMVAVTGGELSPLLTGLTYCSVIATCQQVFAVDRVREWTDALTRWCHSQNEMVEFGGRCLVHRAEILGLGGEWPAAIEEAERASQRLSPVADRESLANAFYQQAEIYRLRGQNQEAESAYKQCAEHGGDAQPGLALLRLANGRSQEAVSAIRRVLDTTTAAWRRARYLPACVDIMLSAGHVTEAEAASEELDQLSRSFDIDMVAAMAAHARGAVRLAQGDAQAAVEPLREAYEIWHRVGAPYIAARIRVLLARACEQLGDVDGCQLEKGAAKSVFERLGATPDLSSLDAPSPSGDNRHGLTERELEVLRHLASGKTNRAIAGALGVSERTIDRHVSNIFHKLDVSTRAAATAFAFQNQLI